VKKYIIFCSIISLILIGITIPSFAQTLQDPKTGPDTNFTAATFANTYRDIISKDDGTKIDVLIKAAGEPVSEDPEIRAKEIRFLQTFILKYLKFAQAINTISDLSENQLTTQIHPLWIKPLERRSDVVSLIVLEQSSFIPEWVKNNAKWWADGLIEDQDFLSGIQYLIEQQIMIVPKTQTTQEPALPFLPNWIKDTAGWWGRGQVTDQDFVLGIQYLIEHGIIRV